MKEILDWLTHAGAEESHNKYLWTGETEKN